MCIISKETQNLFADYFICKNRILDFLKETHVIDVMTWVNQQNDRI